MPIDALSGSVQYVMDVVCIFAFALSGAFLAVRKDFDIFGTAVLSQAAGLGGGLFRDLVLRVAPSGFTDLGYFFTPCIAAVLVYFGHRLRHDVRHDGTVHERRRLFDICDAAALGLFSVTGTIKALDHGFNTPAAVTLGIASALGGGVLAHLLALEQPPVLRWNRDLYALPALVGAGSTALLYHAGLLNVGTAIGSALFAFGLRLLALRYNWRTPRSHFWRNPFAGLRQQPQPADPPQPQPADPPPGPAPAPTPTLSPAPVLAPAPVGEADTVMLPLTDMEAFTPGRHAPPRTPDPRVLLTDPDRTP